MSAVREALVDTEQPVAGPSGRNEGNVLLGCSLEELEELAVSCGQPKYRGRQLLDCLLQGARSTADLRLVPKALREELAARGWQTGRAPEHARVAAKDGTAKLLLQLADGRLVEAVGIPERTAAPAGGMAKDRLTACISSQVGCPMRCTFCATGKGGFARNLRAHEIIDQVLAIQESFGRRVSNVVFMGMGEPLLNLRAVVAAVRFLNTAVGIGARHITISTVGVPQAIVRLAGHRMQATLAVSIHAPNQALRQQLIPSAKAYPLDALMADCREFFALTGRRVTFEYTLMAGVNDGAAQARELAALLGRYDLRSHVNLIPWNPVADSTFQRPSRQAVTAFSEALEKGGVPVSVRVTRGLEAAAACGQLRNAHQKEPLASFSMPA
ncbi:hypothetical protein WJX81_005819 [Elliptochloris bilobata]|uniref:Radical SAM core domain-containing protein n=1 Tax=Elliptochloris bilobata TaxID=381761 RepID=A0AAW1R354_9CHLO